MNRITCHHCLQLEAVLTIAGDGWMQLMKDYGADTEAVNAIQRRRLYVQAKLGELMPAKSRQEAGAQKGKGSAPSAPPFGKHTLSNIRKVAKAEDKIDAYFESASGDGEPMEMSTAGFISFLTDGTRAKKDQQRAAKRAKAAQSIASLRQRDWSGRSGKKSRQPVSKSDRLGVTRRYNPAECLQSIATPQGFTPMRLTRNAIDSTNTVNNHESLPLS